MLSISYNTERKFYLCKLLDFENGHVYGTYIYARGPYVVHMYNFVPQPCRIALFLLKTCLSTLKIPLSRGKVTSSLKSNTSIPLIILFSQDYLITCDMKCIILHAFLLLVCNCLFKSVVVSTARAPQLFEC